ncbi:MAG TPA: hypothetical protein VH440_01690 [Candidatus Limnocylindrales bacterium]
MEPGPTQPDPAGSTPPPAWPPGTTPPSGPASPAPGDTPEPARGRSLVVDLLLGAGVIAILAAVIFGVPALTGGSAVPSPSPSAASVVPSSSLVAVAPSTVASAVPSLPSFDPAALPSPGTIPGGPFATSGAIVVQGSDGALTVVGADGRATPIWPGGDSTFFFPTWSPDGSRIALIRGNASGGHEILLFDAKAALAGEVKAPVTLLRSGSIGPFYLAWTPDGTSISYLADDPSGLSFRIVKADGSAPIDGSAVGSTIRSGNPFYFDWIDQSRVLAHIGAGPGAFLGEIGLDGAPVADPLGTPGDFRSAVVSRDHRFISFIRAGAGAASDVVLAARDGSGERTMPVFGFAATTFDPIGDRISSIGPAAVSATRFSIPIGPIRLLDAAGGAPRTLLDGNVVSDWWSPDGKTIAAIRVQPVGGDSAAPASSPVPSAPIAPSSPAEPSASAPPAGAPSAVPGGSAAASGSPAASAPPNEVRLLFVDVASGKIRSQLVVDPGQVFVDQFLTYFDQYATSHRLWSPDSSSFVIPLFEPDGKTRIAIVRPDGGPAVKILGDAAFWSP